MVKTEQIQVIISKFKDATLWLLFSLSAIILLWKLGQRSLEDWDEAIYAQISKEIVQNGDWITLHYGYVPGASQFCNKYKCLETKNVS